VIAEHFRDDALIAVDGLGRFTPRELLPHSFTLESA
jgi:hypothetical protein